MHHSSIRDHLSKCHPEKSHNSCEPGYIFNSAAVPEPELSHIDEKIFKKIDIHENETRSAKINSTNDESSKNSESKIKKNNSSKNFKVEPLVSINEAEETNGDLPSSQKKLLRKNLEPSPQETDLNHLSSNLFQQQQDMINTILRSSSSSCSSFNGTLNFSNIAANLFQQLNSTMSQKTNSKNNCFFLSDLMRTKMTEMNNALDLSLKTNERKRSKLNDNFYCSDESPVSPVSSISSSSSTTKTSNSPSSVNKGNSKKAISDVIDRLNLNKGFLSRKRNSGTMLLNEEETDDHDDVDAKSENLSSDFFQQNAEYRCKYCNIVFNEYPLYSIHAGMHSNSNPWKCNVCGHLCSNKIDFAVHILHLSKI